MPSNCVSSNSHSNTLAPAVLGVSIVTSIRKENKGSYVSHWQDWGLIHQRGPLWARTQGQNGTSLGWSEPYQGRKLELGCWWKPDLDSLPKTLPSVATCSRRLPWVPPRTPHSTQLLSLPSKTSGPGEWVVFEEKERVIPSHTHPYFFSRL